MYFTLQNIVKSPEAKKVHELWICIPIHS